MIEIHSLVKMRIVWNTGSLWNSRSFVHLLADLNTNVIKLLHSIKLFHVTFRLLFAIVYIIDTSQSIFIKFMSETTYSITISFHLYGMLLNKLLYWLDFYVLLHLNRSQEFSKNISYHSSRNMIKLIVKVSFFKFFEPHVHF